MRESGDELGERIDRVPAVPTLIETRRLMGACNPHEETGIATPPALLHLIARGVARAGLLARVVTVKHEDLLPL